MQFSSLQVGGSCFFLIREGVSVWLEDMVEGVLVFIEGSVCWWEFSMV